MATTLFWQSKPVSAAPVLGGQLFATGNDVEVQVMPASAGFTSELWLFEPLGSRRRIATNRDVGLVVDLGTFPQGTELVFGIHVLNTGDDFRMGPGSRNADGQIHDQVDFLEAGKAQVGFEDLFGGGDRDYNDNVFEFRGGIAPEVPKGPKADAGPDQQVTEGDVVTLDGTRSTDPDSSHLTYLWTSAGASGPPITLSSATGATPSFQTADDGVYRFTLSVSDGTETDTDEVKVTVGNAAPAISTQADPAYEGGVALVTSQFSDAGFLDTHQATIDWNDGTPTGALTVNEGSGWGSAWGSHVYAHAGRYAVTVTVTDDDGGRDTSHTSTVDVIVAPALWANSSSTDAAMESTSGKITVYGLTHTNDDLRLRGDVKTFHGPVEYARTLDIGGGGAVFDVPAARTAVKPFPITFAIADYRPGGPVALEVGGAYHDQSSSCGSDRTWHVVGSTLPSGVYYASCNIQIDGNPIGGTITVVAEGDITVTGTSASFDPYTDGLLFLSGSASTTSIRVDASKSKFLGYSFSERGQIVLTGAGNTFYCGILGDRLDISAKDLIVRGSGCTNPARTTAPTSLVPSLAVTLTRDKKDVLPGQALVHHATVTNDGSTLLVPGIIGAENLGTIPVTVTAGSLRLEYLAASDHLWHAIPGDVSFTAQPNATTGVSYPTGADPIAGTIIGPAALASWGYQALVRLTPDQVNLLLDPARTLAIRNVSTFDLDPASAPVRRLFRFGDDFSSQLRTQGAHVRNVAVTVIPPVGDPRTLSSVSTPALADLAPGASVGLDVSSTTPGPAARDPKESDAAYLARLRAFDQTLLVGAASATGQAGIGRILGAQRTASATRHVPVVSLDKTGPAEIEAGSTAAYQLALANVGSVAASALAVADALNGVGALPVSGAPVTLEAGGTATASASYAVPANTTVQTLADRGTVSWSDAAANHYGPLGDDFSSKVIAKRKLSVIKTAEVIGDPGGDQQIRYEISVTDLGDQPVSNVVLTDTIDPYTDVLADTVTTTQGAIALGSATGDATLTVSLGTLPGRSTAVIGFRVHVQAPLPDGVTAISNQATVTSTELPAILSDDPDQPGATDPTTVPAFPGGAGGSGDGGGGDGGGSLPRPSLGEPTPADGLTVTEPLGVSREITPPDGQTITSWKITYRRVGTTTDVILATGTGAAPAVAAFRSLAAMSLAGDSVTAHASFDPTRVPNGTYLITVSAQASGGGIQSGSTSLIVDGDLKPGRYVTSYQDLNVGVGGMPMQAVRTYDSFDKASGDFGIGWHLDIANFRVNVNKPFGLAGWQQQTAGCGLIFCTTHYTSSVPHFATVVWPDGHQEIFDFAPRDGSTFFSLLTAAAFKGRPGTTSTLAVEGDDSLAWVGDGNLYGGFFGSGPVFDAQRFRLTAKDGTVYILDRSSGLVSATDRNGNSLTVTPAGVVSSLGPSITLTRDPQGRITKMVGPTNETLLYTYSPSGDLASFTDELNRVFHYEYDSDHNLLVSRDPANVPFRTLTYAPDGRLATLADGAGNTTRFQTDIGARQEVVTDPTGRLSTVTTHDARGNVIRTDQTFDGRTITTTSTYDDTDHLTSETDPLGHTSNLAWDGKGNLVTLADPERRTWRLTYTANGSPETIVAPGGGLALRLEYDPAGNLIRQDRAEGDPITFGYTGGQLTSVSDGQGHMTTLELNAEGRIEKITGPDSQTRTFTYDPSGRTLSVTEPDTGVTRFTYDAVGNMLTATDARNQVRRYTYDAAHHLLTDTDFANRTTTYTYDPAGRMVRRSDRTSQVTSYAYDAAGRLTSKTLPGSAVSYTYDPLGRPTSIAGVDGRIDTTYDDAGRVTTQRSRGTTGSSQPDVTLSFGYDTSDLETSLTSPAGSVGYRYDGRGRLSAVDRPGGGSFSFGYDALDRVTGLLHPDGVAEAMTWTDTGQLLSRTARLGSQVLTSSDYTYGNGFLRTSMTNPAGANNYTYDTMGRLLSASHPASTGLAAESFTYDQTSNRTSWVGSPSASVAYTAGRLTRDGTFDYAYDAEGNLVRRTERATSRATTYDWNADHLLTAIHYPDGTTSTYRYDPLGRRIEVNDAGSIRRFVWNGANVVGEYDGSNTLARSYVTTQQPGQVLAARTGATWQSYLVDGTDSVVATVDDSGSVTSRADYDAYGRPATPSANATYSFTGHQYDAKSGLYYARARYYDPAVGRFISEDPIPALNPYQYSSCNPTNLVDSSGMQAVVERSLLDRIREGIAEVALQEVATYICHELVQAAILGFGGGPNVIGQMGEQALGDALGPNGLPQQDLGNRRPDFQLGADYFESKNASEIGGRAYRQMRDTATLVTGEGGRYFVLTRASTAERILAGAGRLSRFFGSTPGVFLIGCLPG